MYSRSTVCSVLLLVTLLVGCRNSSQDLRAITDPAVFTQADAAERAIRERTRAMQDSERPPGALLVLSANPGPVSDGSLPLQEPWWMAVYIEGASPEAGTLSVIRFTTYPAARSQWGDVYPDTYEEWTMVAGHSGVGKVWFPYRLASDSIRLAPTYRASRIPSNEDRAWARQLYRVLGETRSFRTDAQYLQLLNESGRILAMFRALPSPPSTVLDGTEWQLTHIGDQPTPPHTYFPLSLSAPPLLDASDLLSRFGLEPGCNGMGGWFLLEPATSSTFGFRTSRAYSTLLGCPRRVGDVAAQIDRAFAATTRLRVLAGGERLVLEDSAGTVVLAYRRAGPMPLDLEALQASTWTLAIDRPRSQGIHVSYHLSFADSTFEAWNSCGRTAGSYTLDNDRIRFSPTGRLGPSCETNGTAISPPLIAGTYRLAVSPDTLKLYAGSWASVFVKPAL